MLDAPVSGSVPQVRAGTLTIMVGGNEEAYRRVEPVLKARAPFVLELPDEAWFDVSLMRKDVRLALEEADRLHVSAPSGRAALKALTSAGELGYDHRDIAALFEALDMAA